MSQKITPDWLRDPAVARVFALLADHQVFAVGGAVRNALMGLDAQTGKTDVDFASDATPQKVMDLAKRAGIKAIPTGIDHGTVTLAIEGVGFEVTTFRKDVETDGRRAVVAFAQDIETDSLRRDFTMNAIYADARGQLFDPQNGIDDARARHVRFIGDATMRIREDALRILRFFRFYAQFGDPDTGMDAEGLAACAEHGALLDDLSAERITTETIKLLGARDPAPAVGAMAQAGLLARILPGAVHDALAPLVHIEGDTAPDWHRRLTVLGGEISARLRLSKAQSKRLGAIAKALDDAQASPVAAGYLYGEAAALDAHLIRAASLGQPKDAAQLAQIAQGAQKIFPLSAKDLLDQIAPGPEMGKTLKRLEKLWLASDMTLSRDALLAAL